MAIFESARLARYHRILKDSTYKIPPASGLIRISTVGILFNATDLEERNEIINIQRWLVRKNLDVQLLGFIDKSVKVESYPFRYFTSKDINWYYVPDNFGTQHFSDQKFDLLFNLDLTDNLALHYLAAIGKAKLKSTLYDKDINCYNFVLNPEEGYTMKQNVGNILSIMTKIGIIHEIG
jgi:hypothetical protein